MHKTMVTAASMAALVLMGMTSPSFAASNSSLPQGYEATTSAKTADTFDHQRKSRAPKPEQERRCYAWPGGCTGL